ncbi:hypothetical protein MCOR27_002668 [Pyricularia oryzae]|uniref:Roadblock/LAMTOR2 domain-containing protein n=2 Tax=Pyricularia TaxID=48558 RepID=A0ABQ8NZI1_PYRGI|nr:hypothetical protein MCOR01_009738 [Pyricularia oryzae]KAI6304322.1 hypothetical protein MCOR33_000632 [Pyricularia grisea]KAH9436972.1 hypothetical protein MCOR02_000635 [Pyricularia oryzae]KAI6260022.1 hypothetical protein MCOR19_003639 [Pyricularia oryzae]KAI6280944.1 hypothetical protein MCOR26_003518 [Pyricularia oryzae]
MAEMEFRSPTNQIPPPGSAGDTPITDALEETLGRLSKKAGVKATIVLDRSTGAILKISGDFTQIRPSKAAGENAGTSQTDSFPKEVTSATANSEASDGAEQLAAMVWAFIGAAGTLVEDLDTEDELRLLRLRTKKQELVIVPDPKYLLIVIHETLTPAS